MNKTKKTIYSELVTNAIQIMSSPEGLNMTLQEIAESLGVSHPNLSQRFRRETGTTPLEFILGQKVSQAKRLLVGRKDLSVVEIGALSGFGSNHRFFVQFKKATGMTPGEYRSASPEKRLAADAPKKATDQKFEKKNLTSG